MGWLLTPVYLLIFGLIVRITLAQEGSLRVGIEGALIEEGLYAINESQNRPCTPAESSRCRLYESS